MKQVILLFLSILLLSCSNSKNCEDYYNEYVDLRFESKDKKAIISIDKAINCDEKNEEYRFEKVNLLIDLGKYSKAKSTLIALGTINNSFISEFPLKGLLDLRIGNSKGSEELKKVFDNLSKVKYGKGNFNLFYYKLLTELYINGKESTLKEIKNQNIYSSLNEKATIDNLTEMVKSDLDSLDILYKIFKINK